MAEFASECLQMSLHPSSLEAVKCSLSIALIVSGGSSPLPPISEKKLASDVSNLPYQSSVFGDNI